MPNWSDTRLTERLRLKHPIVQGPFGGGLSSSRLAATISTLGGLGSFGGQGMSAAKIADHIRDIRSQTAAPFAINLWVSNDDPGAFDVTAEQFAAAVTHLAPLFDELGVAPPQHPPQKWPLFEDQIEALFDLKPPVFSFIFGVPSADVLDKCRSLGIALVGTATTVEEAKAIDDAGVDAIVASGFEAGGHRASFLRSAESSLTGTMALVPQVVDAVHAPVVAAGGIGDARGIVAALALGAAGVQIGTAFLACEESNASAAHKDTLRSGGAQQTMLSRAFTGRLGRGVPNRVSETVGSHAPLPYPVQGQLVSALREAALRQGRNDLLTFWSGQSASLIRHTRAADLFAELVAETTRLTGR